MSVEGWRGESTVNTYRVVVQVALYASSLADVVTCADKTTHSTSSRQRSFHRLGPAVVWPAALVVSCTESFESLDNEWLSLSIVPVGEKREEIEDEASGGNVR